MRMTEGGEYTLSSHYNTPAKPVVTMIHVFYWTVFHHNKPLGASDFLH